MSGPCRGLNNNTTTIPTATPSPTITRITSKCPKNFIIILGGVGIYNPKDPAHDQNWSHFFRTIQVGFNQGLISADSNECVTWLVHGKSYRARFKRD